MPRKSGSTAKRTVVKKQEEVELEGEVHLKVGLSCTLSACFTSVGITVGAENTCSVEKKDKVYEKLWDLVNSQASVQLEDAEATLESFIALKKKLEREN